MCCVPGCSNDSIRKPELSFHQLPLMKKKLLKVWVHKIGWKNLPLNNNTRVCSEHFVNSAKRRLRPDEYPSLKLPVLATSVTNPRKRKSPVKRSKPEESDVCLSSCSEDDNVQVPDSTSSKSCCTELTVHDITLMEHQISEIKQEINDLKTENALLRFTLPNIADNDKNLFLYWVSKL